MLLRRMMFGVSLSGAGIPSDVLGDLGNRYFDTTAQRWYLKRWVANREGVDLLSYPINAFPSAGDFDLQCCIRPDTALLVLKLFTSSPTEDRHLSIYYDGGGAFGGSLRNADGGFSDNFYPGSGMNIPQGVWSSVRITKTGLVVRIYKDAIMTLQQTANAGWNPSTTQSGVTLLSPNGASTPFKCCGIRFTGPGGSIISPLDDGSGTVVKNLAGADGSLTDGSPTNFWAQSWVPMDLL